jgi:hypothetical protein
MTVNGFDMCSDMGDKTHVQDFSRGISWKTVHKMSWDQKWLRIVVMWQVLI